MSARPRGTRKPATMSRRGGAEAMERIKRYLEDAASATRAMDPVVIRQVSDVLLATLREGRQVFLFGNGGSAATASHFAVDLGKGLQAHDGRRLKALALPDAV